MVSAILSRLVILVFGTLYPAYASYKAVRTKNVKEYVKWMMYWIVFALFCSVETFSDVFLSWLPFYYELKIVFVVWMLSPMTQGSSFLFKKFVHPHLARREKDIDEMIEQASKQGYSTLLTLGTKGLQAVMKTAIMGQSKLVDHLRRSYSTSDLSDDGHNLVQRHEALDDQDEEEEDELDNRLREDNAELDKRSRVNVGKSKSTTSTSLSLSSVKEEEGEDGEHVITETFTLPQVTSKRHYSMKEDILSTKRKLRSQSLPPSPNNFPQFITGTKAHQSASRSQSSHVGISQQSGDSFRLVKPEEKDMKPQITMYSKTVEPRIVVRSFSHDNPPKEFAQSQPKKPIITRSLSHDNTGFVRPDTASFLASAASVEAKRVALSAALSVGSKIKIPTNPVAAEEKISTAVPLVISKPQIKTQSKENEQIKIPSRENEQIRVLSRDNEQIKVLSKENEQVKASSKDNEPIKAPSKENEQVKAPSKENEQTKAPSKENEQTKAPSKENEQTKAPRRENKQIRVTSKENEQIKAPSKEHEQFKFQSKENEQIRVTSKENEQIKAPSKENEQIRVASKAEHVKQVKTTDKERVEKLKLCSFSPNDNDEVGNLIYIDTYIEPEEDKVSKDLSTISEMNLLSHVPVESDSEIIPIDESKGKEELTLKIENQSVNLLESEPNVSSHSLWPLEEKETDSESEDSDSIWETLSQGSRQSSEIDSVELAVRPWSAPNSPPIYAKHHEGHSRSAPFIGPATEHRNEFSQIMARLRREMTGPPPKSTSGNYGSTHLWKRTLDNSGEKIKFDPFRTWHAKSSNFLAQVVTSQKVSPLRSSSVDRGDTRPQHQAVHVFNPVSNFRPRSRSLSSEIGATALLKKDNSSYYEKK